MNYILVLILITLIIIVILMYYNSSSNPALYIQNLPIKLMDLKHVNTATTENVSRSLTDDQIRSLPATFDAWNSQVTVVDQGPWGSCTAYSLRYAYLLSLVNKNVALVEPSTSYLYDQARLHEGNSSLNDTGATNTDIAWVVQNLGIPPLSSFPYTAYNLFHTPVNVQGLVKHTMSNLSFSKNVTTNVANIKNILSQGKGVIIAIYVYKSLMTTSVYVSGIIPQPASNDRPIGGHSIMLSGWDDTTQRFSFRNSWGTYTGNFGVFTIPYNYAANPSYSGDAWYFTS